MSLLKDRFSCQAGGVLALQTVGQPLRLPGFGTSWQGLPTGSEAATDVGDPLPKNPLYHQTIRPVPVSPLLSE